MAIVMAHKPGDLKSGNKPVPAAGEAPGVVKQMWQKLTGDHAPGAASTNDQKYQDYIKMKEQAWNDQRRNEYREIRGLWQQKEKAEKEGSPAEAKELEASIRRKIMDGIFTPDKSRGETEEMIYAAVPYWVRQAIVWAILHEQAMLQNTQPDNLDFLNNVYREKILLLEYGAKKQWFADVSLGQRPSYIAAINTPDGNWSDILTNEFADVTVSGKTLFGSLFRDSRSVINEQDAALTEDAAPLIYASDHLQKEKGQITFALFIGRHVSDSIDKGNKENDPSNVKSLVIKRAQKFRAERRYIMGEFSDEKKKDRVDLPVLRAYYDFASRDFLFYLHEPGGIRAWLPPEEWLQHAGNAKDPKTRALVNDPNLKALISSLKVHKEQDVFSTALYKLKKTALRMTCVDSRCETMGSEGIYNVMGSKPTSRELETIVKRKRFLQRLSIDFHTKCGYIGAAIQMHELSKRIAELLGPEGARLVADRLSGVLEAEEGRRRTGQGSILLGAEEMAAFHAKISEQLESAAREKDSFTPNKEKEKVFFENSAESRTLAELFKQDGDYRNLANHMMKRGILELSKVGILTCTAASEVDSYLASVKAHNLPPSFYSFLVHERIAWGAQHELAPKVKAWAAQRKSGAKQVDFHVMLEDLVTGLYYEPADIFKAGLNLHRSDAITGEAVDLGAYFKMKLD